MLVQTSLVFFLAYVLCSKTAHSFVAARHDYKYCGNRHLTSPTGVLTSPGFPGDYPNNIHCEWKIGVHTVTGQINIILTNFSVTEDNNCAEDYLELFDDSKLVKRYCSPRTGVNSLTFKPILTVIFHTDGQVTERGFRLEWTEVILLGPPLAIKIGFGVLVVLASLCVIAAIAMAIKSKCCPKPYMTSIEDGQQMLMNRHTDRDLEKSETRFREYPGSKIPLYTRLQHGAQSHLKEQQHPKYFVCDPETNQGNISESVRLNFPKSSPSVIYHEYENISPQLLRKVSKNDVYVGGSPQVRPCEKQPSRGFSSNICDLQNNSAQIRHRFQRCSNDEQRNIENNSNSSRPVAEPYHHYENVCPKMMQQLTQGYVNTPRLSKCASTCVNLQSRRSLLSNRTCRTRQLSVIEEQQEKDSTDDDNNAKD